MSVTQKQIAEHLGVSQSLVAHALKGYPQISRETRQRVEEAARELGYGNHVNSAARQLRARRSGTQTEVTSIAVLTGTFFEGLFVQDLPFFKPILQGIREESRRRDLDISFHPQDGRLPRIVLDGGVDGVISLYTGPALEEFRRLRLSVPMLSLGDGAASEWVLRPDDFQGLYQATSHLIHLGHRRIAYLGDLVPSTPDLGYKQRLEGFFKALQDGGVPVRNELVEAHLTEPSHEAGAAGMKRLLERSRDFTAVVCFNDASAWGAMRELRRQGVRVPEDVSVTGFDAAGESEAGLPDLTSVHFDRFEMGRRAVEWVAAVAMARYAGNPAGPLGNELLPVQLVVRKSTASPATPTD